MPRRRTLTSIIKAGQNLESLEAMRDQIAADLDACEQMRDKAALYLRLTRVLDRIEELRPTKPKGDVIDEIADRRAARGAVTAAGSSRTKRPG